MSNIRFVSCIINRILDVISFIIIITYMETETKILDKLMRKMFPFIIRVEEVEPIRVRRYSKDRDFKLELRVSIYVSPTHFCELMDNRVDVKLNNYMLKETSSMIKSIIPEIDESRIKFLFFPDIDSVTIFDGLD
jgi:hypothetical protein